MKKITKLLLMSLLLSVTSCDSFNFDYGNHNNSNSNDKKDNQREDTGDHEHIYADIYEYDTEYHWHPAICEHTDLYSGKLKHNFGSWTIDKIPTVDEKGKESRRCLTCGYVQTIETDKLSSKGREDENPFTIDEAIEFMSSYSVGQITSGQFYVTGKVAAATLNNTSGTFSLSFTGYGTAGSPIFRVNDAIIDDLYIDESYNASDFANATVIVCGYLRKTLASDGITPIYEMSYVDPSESAFEIEENPTIIYVSTSGTHVHTYSTTWSSNDINHWHNATCEHTNLSSDLEAHKFGDWVTTKEPTTLQKGSKKRTCSVCGYEDIAELDVIDTFGKAIDNPFTVDDALSFMSSYTSGQISTEQYYVIGVVAEATYNSTYGSFNLYFEDHTSTSSVPFELYSGVIDTSKVTGTYNATNIIGTTVTMCGYLKKYTPKSGNTVFEVAYLSATESPTGKATSPQIVAISTGSVHNHTYSSSWTSNETYHWNAATCEHTTLYRNKAEHTFGDWVIDAAATTTSVGKKHRACSVCSYTTYETIDKITSGTGTFTLYTFNDFHGAVQEYSSSQHVGIAKFATYLKKVNVDNTLIVDSGDTYQGSIESNYNNGAMLTDIFNYVGVDVHTIGNHDFDWGQDKLAANKLRKNDSTNFSTHFLGANIYDYNFSSGVEGNTFQTRFGDQYYIKTLENGLKVGVIGVIPKNQITSICSPLVEDICFKEHINIVKGLSDSLRRDYKVDVVIASVHESAEDSMGLGLTATSSVTGKKYADYVCCAHSHQDECETENGVYYTQAACYGEMLYKSTFTVNNGNVTNVDVAKLNYSTIANAVTKIDTNVSSIINTYSPQYSSVGNEVIASSTSGTFSKTGAAANLLAEAMYYTAESQGYSIDIANTNNARYNLSGTSWKYSQIYESFPFDNVVYIVKVKGTKNIKELCYSGNYCYHESDVNTMSTSTWYTAAVIDYLLFHTNDNRKYDYFDHSSSNMQILGTIKNSSGGDFLYRDIFATYVKGLSGTLYASTYATSGNYAPPSYS